MKPFPALAAVALAALMLPMPTAEAGGDTRVELLALCLPQLPDCSAPSAECGLRVAPGASVGIRVRATRDGRPLAYTPVVSEPTGTRGMTGADGTARLSLQGPGPVTIHVDDAAPLALDLRWTHLVPIVEYAPTQPIIASGDHVALRLLDEQGLPVPGAAAHFRLGDGAVESTSPADAEGRVVHPVSYRGVRSDTLTLLGAEGCGLASDAPPVDLAMAWATSVEARDPPTLTVVERAWHTGAIPYTVRGGEPPNVVTWRLENEDAWQPAPVLLAEGDHLVRLRAADHVGRVTETVAALRVDLTAPEVTARFEPKPASCTAIAWDLFDAASAIDATTLRIATTTGAVPHTFDGHVARIALPDGLHRVTLRVGDGAGNVALHAWTLSCNATMTHVEPAWEPGTWTACAPLVWTLTGPAPDAATVRLTIQGAGTLPVTVHAGRLEATVPEGTHALRLEFTNTQNVQATRSDLVKCDRTDPEVAVQADGVRVEGRLVAAQRVEIAATDAGSGVALTRARWQGGAWQDPAQVTFSGEGERTLEVEVLDLAGRVARREVTLPLDDAPPHLVAPADAILGAALVIEALDAGSGVAHLDASVPAQRVGDQWTLDTAGLVPGTLLVTVRDHAGNVAGARILLHAPAPPTPEPTQDADEAPPATHPVPPPEAIPAPVTFTLQAIVVTPLNPDVTQPIRITGLSRGIAEGTAELVAPDGRVIPLGALDISPDGQFTASGRASAPGTYAVRVEFVTLDGDRATHEAGSVTVAPASIAGAAPVSGREIPALGAGAVGVLLLALAVLRRKP